MIKFRAICRRLTLLASLFAFAAPATAFETQTWGGTATGSANAVAVSIPNLVSINDILGVPIHFIPAFDNTAAVAVSVGGTVSAPLKRPSSIGLVDLSGAELMAGEMTSVTYTGSVYVLSSNVDMTAIGRTIDFRGPTAPRGSMIEDGSCVSRTTFAPLFSVIGESFGVCNGSTTFGLPFSNGRAFVALDNQGAATANVITSAGSGCDATIIGLCGSQNRSISTAYLPASGLSVPGLSVPSLSVSSLSVPGLSVPGLSVPSLSIPGLSIPGLSVPGLSVPSLTTSANAISGTASIPVANLTSVAGATDPNRISLKNNANTDAGLLSVGTSLSGTAAAGTTGTGTTGTGTTGTGTTGGGATGTGTTGTGTTGGGATGTGTTGTGTTGGGATGNMGSGAAFPVLNPVSLGRRAIKY